MEQDTCWLYQSSCDCQLSIWYWTSLREDSVSYTHLEEALADAKPGDKFQFVRTGFFTPDSKNPGVYNRVVTPVSYTHLDVYKRQRHSSFCRNFLFHCVPGGPQSPAGSRPCTPESVKKVGPA